MRLLWVATKPPHPPTDGGRRLLAESLAALAGAGVSITLVAPAATGAAASLRAACEPRLVATRAGGRVASGLRALAGPEPWALVRHRWPALAREVAALCREREFDWVVAEQLQAFAATAPARERGVPVLLRAQTVESALWRGAAERAGGLARRALAREARRLAAREAKVVAGCELVAALSAGDAAELARLAGAGSRIAVLPAPFPAELPAGGATLAGAPPLVFFGSAGWLPNRDAERWLVGEVWPLLRRRLPGALLHRFGGEPGERSPGIEDHPAPADSSVAFSAGAILLLPIRLASGVRIRILEAWARGIPVVATAAAAAGLEVEDGRELLLAESPDDFATAAERLALQPELGAELTRAGRLRLAADHSPARFAARFLELTTRPPEPR